MMRRHEKARRMICGLSSEDWGMVWAIVKGCAIGYALGKLLGLIFDSIVGL